MIEEIKRYECTCDSCGFTVEKELMKGEMLLLIRYLGMHREGDKLFCKKCYDERRKKTSG